MPDIFETLAAEYRAAEHAAATRIGHLVPRHAQAPATQPVTVETTTPKENRVSLTTLTDDVKADLTDGLDWLDGFVTRIKTAAPGIIAASEAVGGSTVSALVDAVAGRILPPQLETVLAGLVKDFVDRNAPAAADAPVAPPAPSQPAAAPAGQ